MWVERPVSQVGVHLGYSSGGVFPVGHLAGWVELTLLWVCLGGQDSDWVIAVFPTSRRMAGQEKTSANNLSEDDLLKEKLHSGISALENVSEFPSQHLGDDVSPCALAAGGSCSMSVWRCLLPGVCLWT